MHLGLFLEKSNLILRCDETPSKTNHDECIHVVAIVHVVVITMIIGIIVIVALGRIPEDIDEEWGKISTVQNAIFFRSAQILRRVQEIFCHSDPIE